MKRDQIVALDVDDVCADLIPAWQARYNRAYNDNIKREDWKEWDITKSVKPECGADIYTFLKEHDLYDYVSPVPGAQEGVQKIRDLGYSVIFVTSCGYDPDTIAASAGAKLGWLQRHGFLPNDRSAASDYIVAADKSRIIADVLVDDRATTIAKWGVRGILFDRPHNRDFNHIGYRVFNWQDVVGVLP